MNETVLSPVQQSSATQRSLADLIAPVSVREFLDQYWDRRHLVVQRNDPAYYGGLFSSRDIDGTIVAAKESTQDNLTLIPSPDSGRKIEKYVPNSLSLDKAYNAFCHGDTVRLMAVHRTWPSLVALADSLAAELSAHINMNFYLTPVGRQGFDLHVDTHDVFVLQVEGSKEWSIYEPQYRLPVYTLVHEAEAMKPNTAVDEDSAQLLQSVVLRTGDFLYLPRGFPHKARATEEHSLHITVGVHIHYWVDLVKAVIEAATLTNESLRRTLPPGYGYDPVARAQMADTLRSILAELQADPPLEHSLETFTDVLLKKQKYPADGHFAALLGLAKLNAESWVEKRGSFILRVTRDAKSATVRFGENHVSGPASIGPALEFLRSNQRFRVKDLPGPLSDESKLVLARRFVREGLLRPVDVG